MQVGEQGFGKDKIFTMLKSIIENFPNLQIIAISGKNEKVKNHFDNLVNKTNSTENVKVLQFTNKVPELMSVSDLVITKPGGLTTTESLASRASNNCYKPNSWSRGGKCRILRAKWCCCLDKKA